MQVAIKIKVATPPVRRIPHDSTMPTHTAGHRTPRTRDTVSGHRALRTHTVTLTTQRCFHAYLRDVSGYLLHTRRSQLKDERISCFMPPIVRRGSHAVPRRAYPTLARRGKLFAGKDEHVVRRSVSLRTLRDMTHVSALFSGVVAGGVEARALWRRSYRCLCLWYGGASYLDRHPGLAHIVVDLDAWTLGRPRER